MAELSRTTIPSTRRLAVLGSVAVDMLDYTIRRVAGATASTGVDFTEDSNKISFAPAEALMLATLIEVNNWGRVGAVIKSGVVGSDGTRDVDELIIEHNYTGQTAPETGTSSISIIAGDVDGGSF